MKTSVKEIDANKMLIMMYKDFIDLASQNIALKMKDLRKCHKVCKWGS